MYAIVTTGGKQYKVAKDDVITVEKLPASEGDKVDLPVIFLADGDKVITDPAALAKAKVTAEVVDHFKGEKQLVFKFKKRKGYKKLRGHRQNLTHIRIVDVKAGTTRRAAAKKEEAPAEDAAPKEASAEDAATE